MRSRRRRMRGRGRCASGSIPRSCAHSSEQTTTHEAPSFSPGALPAVVVPSGSNTGFSDASFSRLVSRRMLSSAETSPTGTISSSKRPASCAAAARCCERNAQASCSSRLMPSSRDTAEACCDHVLPVERGDEPVEHCVVEDLAVAQPVAEAALREHERRARHRLHPARHDDVVPPCGDHQLGELERPDRRRADLVDRVGGNLLRDSGPDRSLPRRRLPRPCLEHLAHHDVSDVLGLDARALEARPDRDRAELGRGDVCETAAEAAERRPNGRDDDGAGHRAVSLAALHSEARRTVSDTVFCQGPTRAKFVPIAPLRSRRIAGAAAGRYAPPTWLPLAP